VLQGKYNAEVPRLRNQVRDQGTQIQSFQSQLTATQNLLASLSAQRETAPAASTPATPPTTTKLVKDEEVKEFGADLIDVIRRAAREEMSGMLPEIDRRVAPVAQRIDQVAQAAQHVGQRVAQNDQQSVLALLASVVPSWQEMNQDAGFLEWLDQVDPFSGAQRGVLLKQAYKAHDGPRVVAFFDGYLKEHAAVTPPAAPKPAAATTAPQRSLEQMVAPGTPKTGAASTQDGSGKRVWSRAEIGQFYGDVQAGRFKGTKEQRKQIEADIFAAQREGRIR
jgi:prefoldin subunit 5